MTRDLKLQSWQPAGRDRLLRGRVRFTGVSLSRPLRWSLVHRLVVFPTLLDWLLLICDTP